MLLNVVQATGPQGGIVAVARLEGREYSEYLAKPMFDDEGIWLGVVLGLRYCPVGSEVRVGVTRAVEVLLRDACVPLPSPALEPYYRAINELEVGRRVSYVVYQDFLLEARAKAMLRDYDATPNDTYYERLRRPMTPQESQDLILPNAQVRALTDFELYRLQVTEGDQWRRYTAAEMEPHLDPDDIATVQNNPYCTTDDLLRGEVYRWIMRGLTAAQAIRKIQLKNSSSINRKYRQLIINSDL